MDLNKNLRIVTKTGKVLFGVSQARKAIDKKEGKLIVIASNCQDQTLKDQRNVPVMDFPGTNKELGSACGKPFSVSVVTVLEAGDSQILSP